ncbi:MAG: 3-dehydroquinate synthase [Magnetococcales bacterium]|nr:3-dehydroquinate synthase [Magnetococcales bacterium]
MTIKTLPLLLGDRSYDIVIGANLLESLGERLQPLLLGRQICVVSNKTVAPIYLAQVIDSLHSSGFSTVEIILPDGENYKNWEYLAKIFDAFIENSFERSATILALGGGVVGDMSGYAAASLLRGVNFVQVPTTLLSQVDASVGGKTGINHPLGKNLIGAFYQPKMVVMDTETLKTLSPRDFSSGLAEVIKYGIIWDADFFSYLEKNMPAILKKDAATLTHLLYTCCSIKADVVAQDERETGTRALLNLGHTFGHAIETLAGYGNILHGEGVAIGMIMAAQLAQIRGLCDQQTVERIKQLIKNANLPVSAPNHFSPDDYLKAMGRDKKVSAGKIRVILNGKIGQAKIYSDIPHSQIKQAIAAHSEE